MSRRQIFPLLLTKFTVRRCTFYLQTNSEDSMKLKAVEKAAAISRFPAFRIKFQSIQLLSSACATLVPFVGQSPNVTYNIHLILKKKCISRNRGHCNQRIFVRFTLQGRAIGLHRCCVPRYVRAQICSARQKKLH